ncbi:hypothetical protein [Mesorhizobium sp.]|uniref:aldose epimerase family protein n=1 Tax=Mesorhizobium sp. TaxID=1871066 RepID=UPI002579A707|nr:hypothetical protein [Mesorhizobium sp.]
MDKTPFGNTQDGKAVDLYTLTNDGGASIKFIAYGGIITAINVPDRWGGLDNVVLGFKELADYESLTPYFGALIGRYGNRRPVRGMNCDEFGDNVAVLMAGGPLMAARQTFLFLISIEAVKSARAMTWLVCVDTSCA